MIVERLRCEEEVFNLVSAPDLTLEKRKANRFVICSRNAVNESIPPRVVDDFANFLRDACFPPLVEQRVEYVWLAPEIEAAENDRGVLWGEIGQSCDLHFNRQLEVAPHHQERCIVMQELRSLARERWR